jgi:hypothetical protein
VVVLFAYSIAASLVLIATITSRAFHNHSRVTLHNMVYGTAHRPFVYRALVPLTIRVLATYTPETIRSKIEHQWQETDRFRNLTMANGFAQGNEVEYVYMLIILYFSLIGIALVMRRMLFLFYPRSTLFADFAPVILLLILPIFISYFLYDFPNLFLFSLCMLLLFEKKWVYLYLLFPAACLCKETALLIPLTLAITQGKQAFRIAMFSRFTVLCLIWFGVMILTHNIYADNPGSTLEFHLLNYNLPALVSPKSWFQFDPFFLPRGFNIVLLALLIGLAAYGWKHKPLLLKKAVWIAVPIFCLSLFYGVIDEMRVYYEVLAVAFPLMAGGILALYAPPVTQAEAAVTDLASIIPPEERHNKNIG